MSAIRSAAPTSILDGPGLVVGVTRPGNDNITTIFSGQRDSKSDISYVVSECPTGKTKRTFDQICQNPLPERILSIDLSLKNTPGNFEFLVNGLEKRASVYEELSGSRPNFNGSFMDVPNEDLGEHKFSRIVFQAELPKITTLEEVKRPLNEGEVSYSDLVRKISGLISLSGGYVFFRSRIFNGSDPDDHPLTKTLQKVGYELVKADEFHPPYSLPHYSPGSDIPYNALDKSIDEIEKEVWKPENGARVFFKPASFDLKA